jgi:predicted small metal-binding protein
VGGGDEDADTDETGARAGARGGLKTFRCGDVVPGCDEVFRGTEAQILALAGAHAARDHGVDPTDPALLAAVRGKMRAA